MTHATRDNVLIVGAGQAAVQAATTLRARGFKGGIAIFGDEPSPPYQRPPLSKRFLMGELARDRLELKPRSFYEQNNVTLLLGTRVIAIDRNAKSITLAEGTKSKYDKLLLATGARARRIQLPGIDLKNIAYLRSLADVEQIRPALLPERKVVLVGGGYIGLEVAAVCAKHRCNVTVLEMAGRVMNRVVSEPVSVFYQQEHRKAGVTLTLNAMVAGFQGQEGRLTHVLLSDGHRVEADLAIIGIGVDPNIELAATAGLSCRNGILVDEHAMTSDPHIFAAGDCTTHPNRLAGGLIRLESVQNAIDQGRHAALAMLGERAPYHEVPWFWSDQYDLKLQIAGIRADYDEVILRGDPVNRQFAVFYLRGRLESAQVVAVESINAVAEHMIGRKLIGSCARLPAAQLADATVPMKSFLTE